MIRRTAILISLVLVPEVAFATDDDSPPQTEPARDTDTTEALVDAVSLHETALVVVPADDAHRMKPPSSDDPVSGELPPLSKESNRFVGPFHGHAIGIVGARIQSGFVRETYDAPSGTPPTGEMALATNFDLDAYWMRLRFPSSTSNVNESTELSFLLPI